MAGRMSCSLNLPLRNSNSAQSCSRLLKTTSLISWRKTKPQREQQRSKCSLFLGVAVTVVIGATQFSNMASVEAVVMDSPVEEVKMGATPPRRWSDKRKCPPWLENSLETIVPENLPRPSAHRRLELARLANGDAPPVDAVVTRANRAACFSV